MNEKAEMEVKYDLKSVKLPYLAGVLLRLFVTLLESPLRDLISYTLLKNAGITWLRDQVIDEPPTLYPIHFGGTFTTEAKAIPLADLPGEPARNDSEFRFNSVHDYARAYRDAKTTPEEIADKLLAAIKTSDAADVPVRAFIAIDRDDVLKQAAAATKRHQNGQALSVFDGVPVAVKDEIDMTPYPTTVGTFFLGSRAATEDATVVARLRAAGALLIGKTNMHEIGIGVTGLNPHHGTPRNPYNPAHFTGGSSSGSAAATAAGFCPVAIGADGGGSIRIPSSFCGLVGLKPTFGRVSEFGAAPLAWSVAHVGPIGATTTDVALAYGVIAGPDPKDPMSWHQPIHSLTGWDEMDLHDLVLGIYWPWFRHASADIVSACENLVQALGKMGASIAEIEIPDLEAGRIGHVITIASEMANALAPYQKKHKKEHGLDVRMNLALAREFAGGDYLQAQRVRTRMMHNFNRILDKVNMIITPTTGIPAPAIPEAALPHGESDLTTLTEIMRFVTPANFTGLPAISFLAGYNKYGLPIGMQAIGRAWHEKDLLRVALASEQVVKRKKPMVFYDLFVSY